MPTAVELLREGRRQELWLKCCGFLDLSLEEFMTIQRRLLLEQLGLLKGCELGNKVMRGAKPRSVEEFQEQVPITTYADYAPYLVEQREDVLPEKPILWQRTSGASDEHKFKWVPVTKRMYQELGEAFLSIVLLGSCRERGDVVVEEHDKLLYAIAPPPYASGSWVTRVAEEKMFDLLPPPDMSERMTFEERLEMGLKMGLSEGVDYIIGLPGVLIKIGERFSQGGGSRIPPLSQPKLALRLSTALLKSKLARRRMLPRDVWSLKGMASMGRGIPVYKERIKEMWGRYPLEIYACTEAAVIATQTWDYGGMTFLPHVNFLEFIPHGECQLWLKEPTYQPHALLLDEVQAEKRYGMVITNFRGGAFVRYFLGDIIKITSLRNEKLHINTPQMVFDSRVEDLINIAGFTRLTEKAIWQAIEDSLIPYEDWVARKEVKEQEILHIYLELKGGVELVSHLVADSIHEQLKKLDSDYADLDTMLGLQPLEVTVLPAGAFHAYTLKQRQSGADLSHLKPPHLNPSDAVIDFLLNPVHPAFASVASGY